MTIRVFQDETIAIISPQLHGHFMEHLGACIYDGAWRDGLRQDVIYALQGIAPPVIRWPGGCFADEYDWRDGIGPAAARPTRVTSRWGADEIETNRFGTHEMIEFCRQVDAEPWFGGNVGTGSPQSLRDWVEYCNFGGHTTLTRERAANGSPEPMNVRYWGIGNESWDCGGKFTPAGYALAYKNFESHFPRYVDGREPFLIAVGPDGNKSWENEDWTRGVFTELSRWRAPRLHGYDAHFYTWNSKAEAGAATDFTTEDWIALLERSAKIEELILQQRRILDEFDPLQKIALIIGEWGTWHAPTPGKPLMWQQNTLRDAVSAAMTLDIFHRHADKLFMANLAQTINVLQSPLLTEGDTIILTPTYHVFAMYEGHRGGRSVRAEFPVPLVGSASIRDNLLTLSVVNIDPTQTVQATLPPHQGGTATILTHTDLTAHNTVAEPDNLTPGVEEVAGDAHTFPPGSITVFTLQLG